MARGYRPANLDRGRSGTWEGARPTGRACRGTVTSRVHTYVPPPRVTELVATVTESQGPCGDIVRTDDKPRTAYTVPVQVRARIYYVPLVL